MVEVIEWLARYFPKERLAESSYFSYPIHLEEEAERARQFLSFVANYELMDALFLMMDRDIHVMKHRITKRGSFRVSRNRRNDSTEHPRLPSFLDPNYRATKLARVRDIPLNPSNVDELDAFMRKHPLVKQLMGVLQSPSSYPNLKRNGTDEWWLQLHHIFYYGYSILPARVMVQHVIMQEALRRVWNSHRDVTRVPTAKDRVYTLLHPYLVGIVEGDERNNLLLSDLAHRFPEWPKSDYDPFAVWQILPKLTNVSPVFLGAFGVKLLSDSLAMPPVSLIEGDPFGE